MKDLTRGELVKIMTIIENCLLCGSQEELKFDILIPLRQIIPHEVSVCCVGDASLKMKNIITIDYPEDFLKIYLNKLIFDDPLIKEWLSTWKPQIWSTIYYQKYPKQTNPYLKSLSEDYNLKEGISHGFPDLEMQLATHFSFGRSPEKLEPRFAKTLEIVLPHIHQAFIRVLRREGMLSSEPQKFSGNKMLSLREIEVLKWAKEGKTNWEISKILGISERTVKFHLQNIMRKLDAVSKGHAIAKAFESGLLQL
ncbi:MAG: LuxR C-terminal-related transcriptional regulator [Thermodesulfovibrionales bacterium]